VDTWFTFADGSLAYDCAACGQACCRGRGMALDAAREALPLLAREPALGPLVSASPGGLAGWADVTDGCWFLRDDGLCRIEKERGRAHKPATCRLFPFNRVFRVGTLRVVDFNSVICPLRDARGTGLPAPSHRELLAELDAEPDGPLTGSQAPVPPGAQGRWERLERAVQEAASQDRPAVQLCAAQAEAGSTVGLGQRDAAERMDRLWRAWETFHGLPHAREPEAVSRGLALLTPSLRFNTLFRRGGPGWEAMARRMPRLLLATAFLGRAASALRAPPGLRALTELHQASAGVRELMARWDEPAVLASPVPTGDLPEWLSIAMHAASEALSPWKRPACPLGDALGEAWAGLPHPARGAALALLARTAAELRFAET